jgi:hypothetical protein
MASMFPTGAGMASAAWNPSRFAAETAQTNTNPGMPGAGPNAGFGDSMKSIYLPVLALIVLLWVMERRRFERLAK